MGDSEIRRRLVRVGDSARAPSKYGAPPPRSSDDHGGSRPTYSERARQYRRPIYRGYVPTGPGLGGWWVSVPTYFGSRPSMMMGYYERGEMSTALYPLRPENGKVVYFGAGGRYAADAAD